MVNVFQGTQNRVCNGASVGLVGSSILLIVIFIHLFYRPKTDVTHCMLRCNYVYNRCGMYCCVTL